MVLESSLLVCGCRPDVIKVGRLTGHKTCDKSLILNGKDVSVVQRPVVCLPWSAAERDL